MATAGYDAYLYHMDRITSGNHAYKYTVGPTLTMTQADPQQTPFPTPPPAFVTLAPGSVNDKANTIASRTGL